MGHRQEPISGRPLGSFEFSPKFAVRENVLDENSSEVGKSRLSPRQFVQLMFYVNLSRKLPRSASKFEFEYTLETICNKLTLEELSIVSMGFFKTQTHLNSQRISEAILTRLESCFKSGQPPPPDSIMLASLLKFLRMCLHPTQEVILHKTLDAMLPHLKDFSLLCCLHVALLGTNIQVIHEGVLHSLCERFAVEMKNCRIKDIERLAFILTLYNYDPKINPCIFEVMVSEIRNRVAEREKDSTKWEEIDKYGECFLRFLGFLTIRQIFPFDLIEKAMDLAVIKEADGNKWENIGRVVLTLDICLEIYFPDQTKLRLSPALRKKLSQQCRQDLSRYDEGKRLNATDRLLVDVLKHLKSLSGSTEGVILRHILPHFERPDIVFCIRRNREFQNLSLQKYSHTTLHRCDTNSGIWYAVVPCGRNNVIKQSNLPVGPLVHKMSLLKKLGYKPILVPWFEWGTIANEEKENYLKNRIFN
ncbi:FAST kinase domain-containing protein 5, mitochondrial [Hetaerina americana]|uniref:FAST kinase domain-containing protein 5, mitochondrial n=1 Tax=Hetaerina americana TaxID=62018 RepID=UPI003A7F25A6